MRSLTHTARSRQRRSWRPVARVAACASLVALLALVLLSATAAAAPLAASDGLARPTFDRTVVFQLKPDADSSAVLAAATEWGDVVDTPLMALGIYTIVPTTVGASELRAALGRVDGVLWVEPERLVEALAAPNDPRFWDQAALLTMQVARAWEMSPGSWSVIVGVVDSGVGPHPDLAGRVLPGHSVIDSARPDDTTDHSGHGTAVAGIIAAGVNDHSGVAGVTQRVRILPVVVLQSDGSGSDVDTAAGIVWAVDHGADVINLSLGATFYSRPLAEAVRYAYERGVVLVAAVGNDGSVGVRYPAAFPEVIAVGATNSSDQHVTSSNPGPEVDVAAPGVAVLSTGFSDFTHTAPTVLAFSGTSFSAALVTGLAALIVSRDPSLTPRSVSSLIEGARRTWTSPAGTRPRAQVGWMPRPRWHSCWEAPYPATSPLRVPRSSSR